MSNASAVAECISALGFLGRPTLTEHKGQVGGSSTKHSDATQSYDAQGRVIETSQRDANGVVQRYARFLYDFKGRM